MAVLIGTSGWQYQDWRGRFYPEGLPTGGQLAHYAAAFATVELNASFYRLPTRERFEVWAATVPADFVFSVKASRYLTHIKRLRDPAEPVERLMKAATGLGDRLGPILVQLPPDLPADAGRLAAALRCFPDGTRVAVECRHPSWFVEDVRRVLEAAGAAWVLVDPAPRERPAWRTAGWGYVRFHRGRGSPSPCYTPAQLERWAEALAGEWSLAETVYCYFNNDPLGCAPRDARRFASCVSRAGLVPSSVPGPRSTPLARPARRAR